jgi:hypothetical protein
MFLSRAFLMGIVPVLAFGQAGGFGDLFEKAPPEVEQALRTRVDVFYQAHKDGKFRLADGVVHDEAKDIFFAAEKVRFKEYKIVSFHWEENYTKARVVVDIDTDFFFPGFGKMPVHRPLVSFWKTDGGQWWWYVPDSVKQTPFGEMKSGDTAGQPSDALSEAYDKGKMSPQQLFAMVQADKKEVTLSSHEPSQAEVVIVSKFPGPVKLRMDALDMPGLTATLEKTSLETGESAKVSFAFKPASKAKKNDLRAQIHVEPLGKIIPIELKFAYPPN